MAGSELQKLPKELGCGLIEPSESPELKLCEGEGQVGQIEEEGKGEWQEENVGGVKSLVVFARVGFDFGLDEK